MMLDFPGLGVIHLLWDGPMSITDALRCKGEADFGLYALYGTHSIFGPGALLYIGQANARPFGVRLCEHQKGWTRWEPSDVTVYLGRVGGWKPVNGVEWGALIQRAEMLTIFYTSPPYNSQGIKELIGDDNPRLVINHNRRHRLPMCITNIPTLIDLEGGFKSHGLGGPPPQPSPEAIEKEKGETAQPGVRSFVTGTGRRRSVPDR
jgi:hypothetical protein